MVIENQSRTKNGAERAEKLDEFDQGLVEWVRSGEQKSSK